MLGLVSGSLKPTSPSHNSLLNSTSSCPLMFVTSATVAKTAGNLVCNATGDWPLEPHHALSAASESDPRESSQGILANGRLGNLELPVAGAVQSWLAKAT